MKKNLDLDRLHDACRAVYLELKTPLDDYYSLYSLVAKYPKIAEILLNNVKKKQTTYCPFPIECKRFPCKRLYCDYDTLSNGTPRRMT